METKKDKHGWRIDKRGPLVKRIGQWSLEVWPAEADARAEWTLNDTRYEGVTLRVVARGEGISDEDAKISALSVLKERLDAESVRCADELSIIMANP